MSGLARRLLEHPLARAAAVASLVLAMNACLLPQDDILLPDVPDQKNRPPRILESTITPSRLQSIGNGPHCKLSFSFQVEDPDIDDTITVRWYVDYSTSTPNQPQVAEQVIEPSGRAQRNTSAEYTSSLGNVDDPLHAVGTHLVEAVVADGPLVGHDTVLPHPTTTPDGGVNLSYIVTYGWTVEVAPEDCPAP